MSDRLFGCQPVAKDFPVFYVDSHLPSFPKIFLYGLDFDFLMLQVLIITAMDRAKFIGSNGIQSGFVLGALLAFIIENGMIWLRSFLGRRKLASSILADDSKFLIS